MTAEDHIKADELAILKLKAALNGTGCVFGTNLSARLEAVARQSEERMEKLSSKMDKLLWALIGLCLTLATASVTAWLTYILP